MTAPAPTRRHTAAAGDEAAAVWAVISPEFLREVGWSAQDQTISFPRDHQLLGWPIDPDRVEPAQRRAVWLGELPPLVLAQLLYGLQTRCRNASRTSWRLFDRLCQRARGQAVASVAELTPQSVRDHLSVSIQTAARRALLHPDTERGKDVWDMAVFGHGGYLSFTAINQPWLREAAKLWAFDYLPTRRGQVTGATQARIGALARLSESLRLQRADGGMDLTRLGASDITAFGNRMAFLQADGQITAQLRLSTCRMVKTILDGFRILGLTRPGKCLAGLGEDFALRRGQIRDDTDEEEAGKDLPAEVMRVICDGLPLLAQRYGASARAAVELLIDTGRRPVEICQLRLDCLHHDVDAQPILVYDNIKSGRLGRRLPIAAATASVITAQQARTRARYPGTPADQLKLFTAINGRPDGRRSLSTSTLHHWHRHWVGGLPAVTVAAETIVDGRTVAALRPYDMAGINVYAYRHSYAQRHADAGVPVDVLRELMDHRRMDTTQRYYNVGESRRRQAIDRVAQLQFDRHGSRIWRDAKALLDDERVRLAVGEVAVPYGGCREPGNVAAAGNACPIRFRCVGCGHFHTDASYLPDLQAYLADLLRNRERLLAAGLDADEWARQEALPSEAEITRVRRLIDRVNAELDELTEQERAEIEQAVAVVRRGRVLLRVTPPPHRVPDLRPGRVS